MSEAWTASPLVIGLWLTGALLFFYLGRAAAHGAIRVLCGSVHELLSQASSLVMAAQERLRERNREVLLDMGRESGERMIEREFERVNAVVAGDLSGYPALNRKLSDQITRIDEDYCASADVPTTPPEWTHAVEAVAAIPSNGDPVVGKILGDISKMLEKTQHRAIREYRLASAQRHRLLQRMLPFWRRLDSTLSKVDGTIRGLEERSRVIDHQMARYEEILAGSDHAARILSASSMTHFLTSAAVLTIALLGGFINFHLIALPMSEMVGSSSHVGALRVSDIAALVIILTEVAMGVFLMESLRITRMFPIIGAMEDHMRRRMVWISFGLLFTLAGVEASLAYMRDLLAADREALTQSLAGLAVVQAQFRWIPSVGQMVMGFMLPFALAFAAIPIESFIQSSRVVFGTGLGVLLRGLAGFLDLLAGVFQNGGPVFMHLYDLVIIVPLRIEQALLRRRGDYRPADVARQENS
jgi:hypothetical protein